MITRPLDLASRLRKPARSMDAFFYINVGVIVLFFVLFGSRFVLAPGLGVDFRLPVLPEALQGASRTDVVIAVKRRDMALVEGAVLDFPRLEAWLKRRVAGREGLRLLIQADAGLTTSDLTELYAMAREAGFAGVTVAAEPSASKEDVQRKDRE